jgi:F-type H+-transporting ATPase subunit b
MELLLPTLGLFFWTTVIFLGFFFALRKFAWKPILEMLRQRETDIANSLEQAKAAREEMSKLKSDNEALLREARAERERIVKEALAVKEQIIAEAKQTAQAEAGKEREKALQQISSEKRAALAEIKNVAAALSVDLAEKILRKEFENRAAQEAFATTLVNDLNKN